MLPPQDYWDYEKNPQLLAQGAKYALLFFALFVAAALLVIALMYILTWAITSII